jgi:hypothetical protein
LYGGWMPTDAPPLEVVEVVEVVLEVYCQVLV